MNEDDMMCPACGLPIHFAPDAVDACLAVDGDEEQETDI